MKQVLLITFAVGLLSSCNLAPEPQPCVTLPGGWQKQINHSPDSEVALASMLKRMNTTAEFKNIREVRTQVVSGINYDIEFLLDNGEIWNARIHRDLAGNYMPIRVATKGELPTLACVKLE
ncbi:hypothetical protein ACET60_05685 [Aeromonas veronii]